MTEMSSLIALRTPLAFREVEIRAGEIYVRGAPLFAGYLEEGKIVRPLTSDGWFATRDLGEFNEELKIVGRKDRQFISGGENIQPEEIERALASLPGIVSATVTPIDDPEWGQRPVARIVTTEIYTLESLSSALSSLLPRFKHPVQLSTHHPERLSDMRAIGHDILKS
jgi:acyl-CoA synthetase (AMP-forming)/AMP-acid ligase II